MIAVVIPCYRVKAHVLEVVRGIGPECEAIFVVDDACPEGSGDLVEQEIKDPRVRVLRHATNRGVGAATVTGYRAALAAGAAILVKMDGDGQMDAARIPQLVAPIREGQADYVKGNRFFDLDSVREMPGLRVFGNATLSFVTKFSSGYWNLFDPTNGFTALHAAVARQLPFDKVSQGWFFESDLLFRLNTLRAVVQDVPMPARYRDERSNLRVRNVLGPFLGRNLLNSGKRVVYNYFLRNFTVASVQLVLGFLLLAFGVGVGLWHWIGGALAGTLATSGTVMLAALPVLLGFQLLLSFVSLDIQSVPRDPIHPRLEGLGEVSRR